MPRPLSKRLLSISHLLRHLLPPHPPPPPAPHPSPPKNTTNFFSTSQTFLHSTTKPKPQTHADPQSVVTLLESYHFTAAQINLLFSRYPKLSRSNAELTLRPKLRFLEQWGFTLPQLNEIVVLHPSILHRSIENHLKPCIDFLRNVVGDEERIVMVVRRYKRFLSLLVANTVVPNIKCLMEIGVPAAHVSKLMVTQPRSVIQHPARFTGVVDIVNGFGIKPESSMFVYAVRAFIACKEKNLASKRELFKSLGWSEEELIGAVRRAPYIMLVSNEKIRLLFNFFGSNMGLSPSCISRTPKLLMYAFRKWILPRFGVLQVLKEKGLVGKKGNEKLVSGFIMTEEKFEDFYVRRYIDKVPELVNVYTGKN